MIEFETDIGINEYDTFEGSKDISEFGGVALEELPACWDIIKEVVDLEVTSHRTGNGFLTRNLRARNTDKGTYLFIGGTCHQFHLCHSSDGGKGLTTESHSMEGEEVVSLLYL